MTEGTQAAPLSYSEQAGWDEFRADPGTFFNREAILAVGLPAGTSSAQANALVAAVCARHEIFRTGYGTVAGQPRRLIVPGCRHQVAEAAQRAATATAGILTPADLVRAWLRPGPDGGTALCFGLHEMITDPWSCARLRTEVSQLHGGTPLDPVPVSYADYAREERDRPMPAGLAGYWQQRLAGVSAAPPSLRPDGPDPGGEQAGERILILPDHLTAALRTLCRTSRTSPFMVVTALVTMTLATLHGSRDITLATMASTRTSKWADVHGNFSNVTLLRTILPADPSFAEALSLTRQTVLGALNHQPVPFLKLAELAGQPLPRPPIRVHYLPKRAHHFNAALDARPSGASWREETDFAGWPLDLGFAEDSHGRVAIWASYDPRLFSHAMVGGLIDGCGAILGRVAADAQLTCHELAA